MFDVDAATPAKFFEQGFVWDLKAVSAPPNGNTNSPGNNVRVGLDRHATMIEDQLDGFAVKFDVFDLVISDGSDLSRTDDFEPVFMENKLTGFRLAVFKFSQGTFPQVNENSGGISKVTRDGSLSFTVNEPLPSLLCASTHVLGADI